MSSSPKKMQETRLYILVFLLITALCLGGLGFVFIAQDQTISRSDEGLDRAHEITVQMQETLALVYSTLSLQRGYLLSGNKDLLVEYEANKAKMIDKLAKLKVLTEKDPVQNTRVFELQQHYVQFTELLDRMVRERPEYNSAKSLIDLTKVSELRRSLDSVARAMLLQENKSQSSYIHRLEQAKASLYKQLSYGVVLSSIILTLLNYYLLDINGRRREAEDSLRDTEERLRLAIKGTNDGVYDWDIENDELYWSPQFKALLGYEEHEISASLENLDSFLHPDDREQRRDTVSRYLNRDLSVLSCIFRMRHKDGHWIWVRMRGKAIFNEDGKATRLIGTYSDVTSLKEYEFRLEEAKNQAEKANEAKTEFLAHMSHEIRTPLTSISGVAEILMNQKKDLAPKQQQLIKVLSLSTASLKELINDILDFSKIESGQLVLEEKLFGLADLFQEVIGTMSVRAQEKGLRFSFHYEGLENLSFLGDKIRVRQILMNLIGNALKFTHTGFVEVRAFRSDREDGAVLQIEVEDSGIGIDPKNFLTVFEKFRQADPSVSRKYGGSGLGLSISKNLVDAMGGQISLESEIGKGTKFSVILPLTVQQNAKPGVIPQKSVLPESSLKRSGSDSILLVEDYEGNIAVISYILESLGYDYDVARTGLEGVNLWKEKRHNLILMDVQMPEMDGLSATRLIRTLEHEKNMPRTPIIGMTAHAFVEDKDKCTAAGMDSYLAKPIAEADLIAEISYYLEGKGADTTAPAPEKNSSLPNG